MSRLLPFFILIPIIEIWLLARLGALIGFSNTLLLVLLTGFWGAWLARREGLRVLKAIQEDLQKGQMPTDHVLSGLLVLVGGVMLITPGVLTDALGLLLMVPGNRRLLIAPIKRYLTGHYHIITPFSSPFTTPGTGSGMKDVDGTVIEDEGR